MTGSFSRLGALAANYLCGAGLGALMADLMAGARMTDLHILLISVALAGPAGALLGLFSQRLAKSDAEGSA